MIFQITELSPTGLVSPIATKWNIFIAAAYEFKYSPKKYLMATRYFMITQSQ